MKKFRSIAAVSGDNMIRVFNLDSMKVVKILIGHKSPIYTLHFDNTNTGLIKSSNSEEILNL